MHIAQRNTLSRIALAYVRQLVLAVLLLAPLAHTRSADAQGTMGMLPDPITSRELESYADRLGLSPEQRRAINRHYEQYHEQFRLLRDNEIADFLQAMQQMQRSGMQMPNRREMDRFTSLWDTARRRIAALDDQFFLMIQDVMTDQQRSMVERVRLARERHRHSGGMSMGMMGRAHDLSESLLRMNLTPNEREAMDDVLADYERRLTAAIRSQSEAATGMMFGMYDALEEAGFSEDSMSDPAEMARMMEHIQLIMQDMFQRIADEANALKQLNYRSYRTLAGFLHEPRRRLFRDEFIRGTFPEVGSVATSSASQQFAVAVTIDALDAQVRDSIAEAQAAFEAERDQLADQAMRFAIDNASSPMDFMFGGGESDDEYQQRLSELGERAQALDRRGIQTLSDLLDEDAFIQVGENVRQERLQEMTQMREERGWVTDDGDDATDGIAIAATGGDAYVPGAISTRETAIYADLMMLDEDGRAMLEQLHEQYATQIQTRLEDVMTELVKANQARWQSHGDASETNVAEVIADVYSARRRAMAVVAEADERFFSDLQLLLNDSDEALNRVRMARQRARCSISLRALGGAVRGESLVDLTDVVRLLRWTAEQRQVIEEQLVKWEHQATAAMADHLDASLAHMEATERFFAQMHSESDSQQWVDFRERQREALGDHQKRVAASRAALRDGTRAAKQAIVAALSADDAAVFHDTYRRRAFPSIFNDRHAVDSHLRRALRLPDLSESQRDALRELNMHYNARYRSLTDQMVRVRQKDDRSPMTMSEPEEFADYMQQEGEFNRLEFERGELNAGAIRELRGLLSERQLEALGSLPPIPASIRQW